MSLGIRVCIVLLLTKFYMTCVKLGVFDVTFVEVGTINSCFIIYIGITERRSFVGSFPFESTPPSSV